MLQAPREGRPPLPNPSPPSTGERGEEKAPAPRGQRRGTVCLPSPLYSGERGRGRGVLLLGTPTLSPNPSPLSTGERGEEKAPAPRGQRKGGFPALQDHR